MGLRIGIMGQVLLPTLLLGKLVRKKATEGPISLSGSNCSINQNERFDKSNLLQIDKGHESEKYKTNYTSKKSFFPRRLKTDYTPKKNFFRRKLKTDLVATDSSITMEHLPPLDTFTKLVTTNYELESRD